MDWVGSSGQRERERERERETRGRGEAGMAFVTRASSRQAPAATSAAAPSTSAFFRDASLARRVPTGEGRRRRRRRCPLAGPRASGGDSEAGESRTSTVDGSQADRAVNSALGRPAGRRRVTSCECAEESLYELLAVAQEDGQDISGVDLHEATLEALVEVVVEAGNPDLAVDLFRVLYGGSRTQLPFTFSFDATRARSFLLIRLIRSLYLQAALKFLEDSCKVSMPGPDQVSFGTVVSCPTCGEGVSLSVVKAFHGEETIACASCKYQYDLYSGQVVSCESEVPDDKFSAGDLLQRVSKARVFAGNGNRFALTHKLVVDAPDGTARAYKFATETDEVPASVGDRVTLVCASAVDAKAGAGGGPLAPIPPGAAKGEPRSLYNHRQGKNVPLLRSFDPDSGIPLKWLVLGAALFAGGDSTSALINPDFPALIAAGAVGVTSAGAVAKQLVLPQLAKLPSNGLASVEYRQQFLGQYDIIKGKLDDLLVSMNEDIQLLSRLWSLHHKIEALGTSGSYDARLQKILASATTLEDRVGAKMQLVEGYSRVSHMIEIEIELDADIDAAEASVARTGITEELVRVEELEDLKEEWTLQVEAKDEIERLLGSDQLG